MADSLIEKINAGGATYVVHDVNAVPNTRKINNVVLNTDITLSGDDVKLTGYTKGSSTAAVAATDKVNEAIAKHENRIDTNRTNILLVEQLISDGIINVFDSDNATLLSSPRCTVSSVNGDITITSFSQWANAIYSFGKLKAGQYIISLTVSEYSAENPSVKFGANVNDILTSITGNGVYNHVFNASEGDDCTLCLYINYSSTTYSNSIKVSNIAVIPKKYYDMGFSFAEYAPSNKGIANEISVLETLNGAKNYSDFINNLITSDQTVNGNSVTITGTAAYKRAASMLNLTEQGNYIITLNVDTLSELGGRACALTITDNTTSENIISIGLNAVGKYVYKFTATSDLINHGIQIRVFVNNSATTLSTANTITVSDVMVVKKSVWDSGLTQYVPHALPNYELTKFESEDRAALVECVDEGAKNRLNFDAWKTVTSNRANLSFSGSSVTLESFIADAFTAYEVDPSKSPLFPSEALIPFTIGEQIVFTWDYTANSGQSDDKVFIFAYDSSYQQVSARDTLAQNKKIQMSIPSGTAYVTFRVGVTTSGNSATYSNLMFCTKSKSDISPAYEPHALPNTDLTRMQAEDRAALAEVVDSGAKNLLNYSAWVGCTVSNGTGVFENNGVTLTATSNNVCHTNFLNGVYPEYAKVFVNNGDKITFSWDYEYQSETGASIHIYANGAVNQYEAYAPITAKQIDYTVPTGVTFLTFCALIGENNQGKTVKFKNLMICTKAAFDVSQKFVPYRKNLDQLEATKAPALALGPGVSSGSLDDVTKPTFDLYLNTVSNLPTSAAYYVETSVWDSQSMIQRAYNVGNADSYIRVKSMNTWSAWKQITNA